MSEKMTPQFIMRQITARFSASEIKTLCFDLGIQYENLPVSSQSSSSLARELALYCQRRGRLDELVAAANRMMPNVFANQQIEMEGERQMNTQSPMIHHHITAHAMLKLRIESYERFDYPIPQDLIDNIKSTEREIQKLIAEEKREALDRLRRQQEELRTKAQKRADINLRIEELERELSGIKNE